MGRGSNNKASQISANKVTARTIKTSRSNYLAPDQWPESEADQVAYAEKIGWPNHPQPEYYYGSRLSATAKALLDGEIVEIEGVPMRRIEGLVRKGDFYFAEKPSHPHLNPKLLTCRKHHFPEGYIVSEEAAYSYNTHHCIRVEIVD